MANRQNQHISSPAFQELAYRALKKISAEQKANLNIDELKIFQSERSLQRFCKEERFDRVAYMLAKAGKSWTFRIEDDSFEKADLVELNTSEQYLYPMKRMDVTDATAREGICVISSRDVMTLSHYTAQNCTTKVYHLSEFAKDMAKKGKDLKQLTAWDDAVKRTHGAFDLWGTLILEQLNSFEYAAETLGLDEKDLRVMMALFKKRNSAIRMSDIAVLAKSKGKKMYFRKNLEKLLELNLIVSEQKDEKKMWANTNFFMITTLGLDKILSYMKYVYQNSFGT